MIEFRVTYIGSKHERMPNPQPVEVEAANVREAIRKVGPVRDGCIFDVTQLAVANTVEDMDAETARFAVRMDVTLEPLDRKVAA